MDELYTCSSVWQVVLQEADGPCRRWPERYSIIAVLEGKGQITIGGEQWFAGPGTILFGNPNRFVELRTAGSRALVAAAAEFRIVRSEAGQGEEVAFRETTEDWLEDGLIETAYPFQMAEMIGSLVKVPEGNGGRTQLAKDRLLYDLLLAISGETPENIKPAEPGSAHETAVSAIASYLRQHYNESITREAMAAKAGFHPRVFSRLFKEATGTGFADYLAGIRIRKAKEQVLLTGLNLDEIARNVGYSNGLYLSRKFKQLTGVSPKAYIRQPKRVVVYDWVGHLLALGVQPVGASYFGGLSAQKLLREELQGVVDVGRTSVQPVIDLDPELIVAPMWLGTEMISKLQAIAPTMTIAYGDPVERLHRLAEALGRQEEAARFVSRYRKRALEIREEIAHLILPGQTVGLYELSQGGIWIFSEFHGRGGYNLYRAMGFQPPAAVSEHVMGKGMITRVELTELPAYAADHMFVSYPFTEDSRPWVTAAMAHPVWEGLPAYRNNRIYFIDRQLFHSAEMLSMMKQLELQRALLLDSKREAGEACRFVHEINDFNP